MWTAYNAAVREYICIIKLALLQTKEQNRFLKQFEIYVFHHAWTNLINNILLQYIQHCYPFFFFFAKWKMITWKVDE